MKTNKKVLAGALALALGLGAVVPAFAEGEKKADPDSGIVIIDADYRKAEKAYMEAYKAKEEAIANTAEKQAALDAANKARVDADKAVEDFWAGKAAKEAEAKRAYAEALNNVRESRTGFEKLSDFNKDLDEDPVNKAYREFEKKDHENNPDQLQKDLENFEKVINDVKSRHSDDSSDATKELFYALGALRKYVSARTELVEVYNDKNQKKLADDAAKKADAANDAENKLAEAKKAEDAAIAAYNTAKKAFIKAGAHSEVIAKYEKEGIKSVELKTTTKAEQIADLKASLEDLKSKKGGLEMIKTFAPKYVEKHQAEYDALLAKVNERIAKTEAAIKALQPKTALLFSTAYADGDAESVDVKAILEENERTSKEVEDFIKGLDEEEEPSEEKPAEEKPSEEKPAEEKPAEEKPAEDNKATVKPAARSAKNPKTGVASVAGVAAVLAAASAAYVDSKRK